MPYQISGTAVINDSRKGIFTSINITPYSGSSNYPSGAAAGDVIYDSSIKELKVYDGSAWV